MVSFIFHYPLHGFSHSSSSIHYINSTKVPFTETCFISFIHYPFIWSIVPISILRYPGHPLSYLSTNVDETIVNINRYKQSPSHHHFYRWYKSFPMGFFVVNMTPRCSTHMVEIQAWSARYLAKWQKFLLEFLWMSLIPVIPKDEFFGLVNRVSIAIQLIDL